MTTPTNDTLEGAAERITYSLDAIDERGSAFTGVIDRGRRLLRASFALLIVIVVIVAGNAYVTQRIGNNVHRNTESAEATAVNVERATVEARRTRISLEKALKKAQENPNNQAAIAVALKQIAHNEELLEDIQRQLSGD